MWNSSFTFKTRALKTRVSLFLPRIRLSTQRSSLCRSDPTDFLESNRSSNILPLSLVSSSNCSSVHQRSSPLCQIIPLSVSVLRLFVRSFLYSLAFFVSSSRLFVLSLLKTRSSTQSLKIRLSTSILLQPNRPSSTKSSSLAMRSSSGFVFLQVQQKSSFEDSFCFLELESYRLEIYVAKLVHDSSRTRV